MTAHVQAAWRILLAVRGRRAADARTRWAAIAIASSYVGSRLIVLASALAAEGFVRRNPALTSGDSAPILQSLTSWDGWWYLGIARDGYHVAAQAGAYHDYAFFPLYPLVVRALALPWPQWTGLVAVAVSNVAFALALALLYLLGRPYLGERRAAQAAGILAIFPFGAAFAMAYAESLFLALLLAAFLAAERDRRVWAGIFLALAGLSRLQGVLLTLPLWVILLRRDAWRPRASQAWLLLGPLAALGFVGYVAQLTGNWRGYLDAQAAWGRVGIGNVAPAQTLGAHLSPLLLLLLLVLGAAIFLLVYVRPDGMRLEYALVPILFLGAVFASADLESVGRYAMLAFPYAWILASRRNPIFRRSWPVISAGLLALFGTLSFAGYFVP